MDSILHIVAADSDPTEWYTLVGRGFSWLASNLPVCLVVLTVAGPLLARVVKAFKATQAQAGKDRLAEWLVTQTQKRAGGRTTVPPAVRTTPTAFVPSPVPAPARASVQAQPRAPGSGPHGFPQTVSQSGRGRRTEPVSSTQRRRDGRGERPIQDVSRGRSLRRALVLGEALSAPGWSRF